MEEQEAQSCYPNKKSCSLLNSHIWVNFQTQTTEPIDQRGGWVPRKKNPKTLKQVFTVMIAPWPMTIFSANYILGKEEYPDISQGLKGSCYSEIQVLSSPFSKTGDF